MRNKLKLGVLVLACMAFLAACSCSKGEYTVTFDSTGGSAVSSQTVAKGETAKSPADPKREGYTFAGWYLNLSDSSTYDFSKEVTKDITLKAKWLQNSTEAGTYNVTFDSNGGSDVSSVVIKTGEVTILPTPTRSGYNFLGWYDGETLITSSSQITANTRLTAKWEQVRSTNVNPNNNGSTSQTNNGGSSSNTPAPTPSVDPTPVTPTNVTVTFVVDGANYDAVTVEKGSTLTNIPTASKDGYTFDGWFNGSEQLTLGTVINSNITYTAKFTEIPAPVTETYSLSLSAVPGDTTGQYYISIIGSNSGAVAGSITYKSVSGTTKTVNVAANGSSTVRKALIDTTQAVTINVDGVDYSYTIN